MLNLNPDQSNPIGTQQGNRWYYFLSVVVALTFLLQPYLNSYAIGGLVLGWMLIFRFQFKWNTDLKTAFFYAGFYVLHIAGLLYTDHLDTAGYDLETKASILIIPLIYVAFKALTKEQVENLLVLYVCSVLIGSLVTLGLAFTQYLETGAINQFFYHDLSNLISMHAIYLSMYVCFAILILLQWLVSAWDKHSGMGLQIGLIVLVFYLFSYNILLSARMPTLALCLVVFAGILKVFYDRRGLFTGISIIVLTTGILLAGIYFSPVNKQRYKEALDARSIENSRHLQDGRTLRLMKWDCCVELLKSHWLFGLGTGDVQYNLNECYKSKQYTYLIAEGRQYNAHNQYFQTWLGLGIIGLVWFLGLLMHSLYAAWQRRYYLHVGFVVMFAIVNITESTLPVHKGVVFFMFFNTLLLYGHQPWPWRKRLDTALS